MTESQLEQVDDLFGDLLEQDPSTWPEALASIADPEVCSQVQLLLRHSAPTTKGLDSSIAKVMRAATDSGVFDDRSIGPGTRFERYRIQRKIGQGGMGDVYEAVRENDFHKRVALKIVRYGLDSDFARGRFQQERQTLALLEHPFIARLLDGGEAENGCPYLVLEFVDGVPIDTYSQGRPQQEILELFLKACEAVEYAHRNLVIHRDLKPANILVTADGDPKLLDFGIAKLLDPSANVTQTVAVALTPQYASPEQIRNLPITTASDVYSLGVILYQLLTGRKPYDVQTTTPLEMERVICSEPPAHPALGNELDDILMMALRKEPERRYATVTAFADDIRRFTTNQPVLAAPDTFHYRSRKYIGRHWVGLAATAAVMLALTLGAGVAMYQAHIAKQRLAQVRKLANTFLFDFHDQIVNIAGTTTARAFVVKTAQSYLDDLSRTAGSDPELQAELAQAYERMGDAQGKPATPNLNDRPGAEASYRRACALYESLAKRDPKYTLDAVDSWRALAVLLRNEQRGDEMRKALDHAFVLAAPLERDPSSRAQLELAGLHQTAGDDAEETMDSERNIREDQLAVAYMTKWARLQPASEAAAMWNRLGKTEMRLGRALWTGGHLSEAVSTQERADADLERAFSLNPQNARYRSNLLSGYATIAQMYNSKTQGSLEQPREAILYESKALELAEPLVKADPDDRNIRAVAIGSRVALAESMFEEKSPKALPLARQCQADFNEMIDQKALSPNNELPLLDTLRTLVPVFSALGDQETGYNLATKILRERRKALGTLAPDDDTLWYIVIDLQVVADAARAAGREAEAGRLLDEALQTGLPFMGRADRILLTATFEAQFAQAMERDAVATGRCSEAHAWRAKEVGAWTFLASQNPYAAKRLRDAQGASGPCSR